MITDFHARLLITGACAACGKPLEITQWYDADAIAQFSVWHPDGCAKPSIMLTCDNPRPLGVVTGVTA